jgi:hypothetical protein
MNDEILDNPLVWIVKYNTINFVQNIMNVLSYQNNSSRLRIIL